MALRSSWKGYLRLSLVTVPVKAYSASASGQGEIHLNQLHAGCNRRIRYQKVCPLHGEVSKDEIASGYEYAKGQYVVIEPEDLDRVRTNSDKAINIDKFIAPSQIDPIYFDGRTSYLVPDGPVGQKPYVLLYQAMVQEERYAVGQVALSGRDELVLVRPTEGVLAMSLLKFESQVRRPTAFQDEIPDVTVLPDELRLARTLIQETAADEIDWSQYRDAYTEKLTQVIEAKIAGQEVIAPQPEEEVHVINLMDALRESVARAQGTGRKPPQKMAASKRAPAAAKRKRKSS
jgi:DNA end-binding protein Ku